MESRQSHLDDSGPREPATAGERREPGGLRGRPGPASPDEPPYQGDCPVTGEEMDRLLAYARWARREVTILREQRAGTDACVRDLVVKNEAQARVIQGYEARELLRKNSIQTYELGLEVRIKRAAEGPDGCHLNARICSIRINRAGVSYRVDWWHRGDLHATWVRHDEVEPVDEDVLSCPSGV